MKISRNKIESIVRARERGEAMYTLGYGIVNEALIRASPSGERRGGGIVADIYLEIAYTHLPLSLSLSPSAISILLPL